MTTLQMELPLSMPINWQPHKDALRVLAEEKQLTSRAIAKQFKTTRNAVIGACRRLNVRLALSRPAPLRQWTPEMVEALHDAAEEGLCARRIAAQLNLPVQTVRDRARTQGIVLTRERRAVRSGPSMVAEPRVHHAANADIAFGVPTRLQQLSPRTCRWPIGDPGTEGFHFCGAKPEPSQPYCTPHCGVAFRSTERTRWR